MKTFVCLFITCCFLIDINAQTIDYESSSKKEIKKQVKEESRLNKSFNKNKTTFGFYFGQNFNYGLIADDPALIYGARLGFIINDHLAFGFAGRAIYSPQNLGGAGNKGYFATGGYGGVFVEPILFPKKALHLSFPVSIGAGAFGNIAYNFDTEPTTEEEDWDLVVVLEPGINLEYKATSWLRIGAEVNYRLVGNHVIEHFRTGDFDGFNAGLCLKLGWFGKR